MKVFIIPLNKMVDVKRMPYIEWHVIGAGFTPRHYQVEAIDGQIYEVPSIAEMIYVFDGSDEMVSERELSEEYREKAIAYFETYSNFKKELKLTPGEFMKVMPFDKFK